MRCWCVSDEFPPSQSCFFYITKISQKYWNQLLWQFSKSMDSLELETKLFCPIFFGMLCPKDEECESRPLEADFYWNFRSNFGSRNENTYSLHGLYGGVLSWNSKVLSGYIRVWSTILNNLRIFQRRRFLADKARFMHPDYSIRPSKPTINRLRWYWVFVYFLGYFNTVGGVLSLSILSFTSIYRLLFLSVPFVWRDTIVSPYLWLLFFFYFIAFLQTGYTFTALLHHYMNIKL